MSTPTKPPAKNSNIFLSETAYQQKLRNEEEVQENKSSRHNSVTAAVSNGQTTSQALASRPQALTEEKQRHLISKQSPSPLHHTFLLGRARFTAQPLSALLESFPESARSKSCLFHVKVDENWGRSTSHSLKVKIVNLYCCCCTLDLVAKF